MIRTCALNGNIWLYLIFDKYVIMLSIPIEEYLKSTWLKIFFIKNIHIINYYFSCRNLSSEFQFNYFYIYLQRIHSVDKICERILNTNPSNMPVKCGLKQHLNTKRSYRNCATGFWLVTDKPVCGGVSRYVWDCPTLPLNVINSIPLHIGLLNQKISYFHLTNIE